MKNNDKGNDIMSYFKIEKSKIIKPHLPKTYDVTKVSIGIPVENNEHIKLGLTSTGDIVTPSPCFGKTCEKNANEYYVTDKTKPKEKRYVTTVLIQKPFGNDKASPVITDIYRMCYPKIRITPYEIGVSLVEDDKKNKYIIANLPPQNKEKTVKEAINIFLEIFGFCYIYSETPEENNHPKKKYCNWEILPPGKKPSDHLREQSDKFGAKTNTFDIDRLETLDKYQTEKIVGGINGFMGYYAYIFSNCCVLESAIYGNATYIIPKENWEVLSQKTKQELLNEKTLIKKIIHHKNWYAEINETLQNIENQ